MSTPPHTELDEGSRREMAAAHWVVRLQAVDVEEAVTDQWLEWCQADARNLAEFERARALWNTFGEERLRASLALELKPAVEGSHVLVAPAGRHQRTPLIRPRGILTIAASVLLLIGVDNWLSAQRSSGTDFSQTLSTASSSLSRQSLPDGSIVELGARSRVRLQLTRTSREIFVDDGEAFFKVAKDTSRPFIVHTGDVRVTALGTQFNVRKADDHVVVTVKEGVVSVSSPQDQPASSGAAAQTVSGSAIAVPVRADAGQQIIYSGRKHSLTLSAFKSQEQAPSGWQVGHMQFVAEPMSSVVADVNRYSMRPISVADERVGKLIFTGTVRGDAVSDWLQGIQQVFHVRVIDEGEKGLLIALPE